MLPLGAVEQHRPHLPLATDQMTASYFRDRIEAELGDEVLTLPPVAVGFSAHHRDFPDTLSVSHETLICQITGIISCAFADGFTNLLILNTHGGNEGAAQVALEQLGPSGPGGGSCAPPGGRQEPQN